ncbi:MAG: hypothetical protein ACJ8F7_08170 [Gemmataceae bacterium]
MTPKAAFLLSPYALPTDHAMMLAEAEMAAWLNGYVALWHPAVLAGAEGPPKQASQYDHETPGAGHVYAVPDAPELYQPDDWKQRVQDAGAVAFTATSSRDETVANLRQAYPAVDTTPEAVARLELPAERVRPFLAVGFGYLIVEHLFDAMHHEHLLATGDFWQDVQNAVSAAADAETCRKHLQAAADKLLSAREVLYTAPIHLLDVLMPDERKLEATLPTSLAGSTPINLVAAGQTLERIREEFPARFEELKQRLSDPSGTPTLELCVGCQREREDAVLPLESQLWNLRRGKERAKELLGAEVRVFGRRRSAFQPHTPQLLQFTGFEKALLVAFDGAVVPSHRSAVVNWSSPDGKSMDVYCRTPQPAHQAQSFFNLVHTLHETIMQDTAATFALLHTEAASACYSDWLELSQFGPILGTWTTFSRYFGDTTAGEYAPAASVDDFFSDYLEERTTAKVPDAVSGFARHLRQRRRLDVGWGHLAILRGLGVGAAGAEVAAAEQELAKLEEQLEGEGGPMPELVEAEGRAAKLLADRLQVRAADNTPGFLLLNPCSFIRRTALELDGVPGPIPVEGPVKSAQFDGDKARLVVEVPAFGFAWIPRSVPGAAAPKARMRLADTNIVRNEFFEAEIDPASGGLKAFRDARTRGNRLGQQLVFNPGSVMLCREVKVTCNGPALGEVTSEGGIFTEHNERLASFRQRFRAWLGRPLLEMRCEIYPVKSPEGYPWHAYYAARFAWRDERATLLRGSNGQGAVSNHTRPVTPEFLELRTGADRTAIFPGGLPFHQRHGSRMLDVILVPEGEQGKVFDIALGMEREHPAQTALGLATPVSAVPTAKGPPHIGPSGWLFHLDAPNLMLSSLRPTAVAGASAAVVATLLEISGFSGAGELRCVRNPVRAVTLDPSGNAQTELSITGDAVTLDLSASDLTRVRVEFA